MKLTERLSSRLKPRLRLWKMYLELLFSLGNKTDLGLILMGILLFIDYRQMLQINNKKAFGLTVKTGLWYLLILILFYVIIGAVLLLIALSGQRY